MKNISINLVSDSVAKTVRIDQFPSKYEKQLYVSLMTNHAPVCALDLSEISKVKYLNSFGESQTLEIPEYRDIDVDNLDIKANICLKYDEQEWSYYNPRQDVWAPLEYKTKQWNECTSHNEKVEFFMSGRAVEVGLIEEEVEDFILNYIV